MGQLVPGPERMWSASAVTRPRKGTAGEAGAAACLLGAAETACRKISMVRPKGGSQSVLRVPVVGGDAPLVALSVRRE